MRTFDARSPYDLEVLKFERIEAPTPSARLTKDRAHRLALDEQKIALVHVRAVPERDDVVR